jgi:hypothetical protein
MSSTKLLSIFLIAALVSSCGSDKTQAQPAPQSDANPVVAESGEQTNQQIVQLATFVPNQPQQIELEHTEKEAIFEDRDVPSTCTRQVQQGTRNECSMDYRNECRTNYTNECRDVPFETCHNAPENVCRNVSDRVCHNESVPVCQSVPRRVCETVRGQCHQETQHVCDSRGCRDVPRTVCGPEQQSCHTVNDNVCHNETRQRCENVSRRECHLEDRRVCRTDTRQECRSVPHELCSQVPFQSCREVPVYGDEQYACSERRSVQVGERVTLHQIARVKIELRNPKNLNVSVDSALVTLEDGSVQLEIQGEPTLQYRVRRTAQTLQRLSESEQLIQATFIIDVL